MKGITLTRAVVILMLFAMLGGCAVKAPNLYHWGEYENLVHDMYVKPGKADPQTQIVRLNADIEQAHNRGKMVPPGVYAHLGMLYAMMGQVASAEQAFIQERRQYPESKVLIDGMLERARGGAE